MKALMVALALIVPASGALAQQPERVRTAAANRNIDWPDAPANARYRVGDVTLDMRNIITGAEGEELNRVLTINVPGLPAFTINEDGGQEPTVMVIRMRSGQPAILWQSYSGGAHCCTMIELIQPRAGRLEAVPVYAGDGGPIEQAPRDIDGDGVIDIVRYDNSFLYTFASYAESAAPPTVTNVINGEAVDVSTRPAFRRLFEEVVARDGASCRRTGESNRNGACASYVAASARIGRFDAAWADMLRHWDREADWDRFTGCRVTPAEGVCPDGQEIVYPDFPTSLRGFLIEQRYIAR